MSLDPAPPRGRVAGLLGMRMLHAAAEHPHPRRPAGPILASCPVHWRRRAAPSLCQSLCRGARRRCNAEQRC